MTGEEPVTTASTDAPAPDTPSRVARITAGLIVLLIFLIPLAGFVWLRQVSRQVAGDAVLAHAANMLVRYSARTRGQWPDSWDDLEEDFEPADANFGTPSLAVMKQAVEIDFAADLSSLPAPDEQTPPPRLLWLRERPDSPEVRATNRRLIESLRRRGDG
jgi:hypothetical protein